MTWDPRTMRPVTPLDSVPRRSPLPFVIIGDAPLQHTGLSRIATDLAWRLWDQRQALNIELYHIGQIDWPGLPPAGVPLRLDVPWPVWAFDQHTTNRDAAIGTGLLAHYGTPIPENGVLFAVQDPSRSYGLLPSPDRTQGFARWARWGYFPVDGVNAYGTIGGPAATAIRRFDEVLAYGPYGQGVLSQIRGMAVHALPHGIDLASWTAEATASVKTLATARLDPLHSGRPVIGCVATNVARKDLPLFISVLRKLRDDGVQVRGWLHVDREIGDWCLPQLCADANIDFKDLSVTLGGIPDAELAEMYRQCACTVAVGRGEGFGYPILESLAVGTPVVAVRHAGGLDLIREEDHACGVFASAWHPEGLYGILRPILDADHVVGKINTILQSPSLNVARLAIPYDWATLGPLWDAWFRSALSIHRHNMRTRATTAPFPGDSR